MEAETQLPRRPRVCLVTPEFEGLTPFSDMGAHCARLAQLWAEECELTVLFTGTGDPGRLDSPRDALERLGVRFRSLDELPSERQEQFHGARHANDSRTILRFLESGRFDAVHFQDRLANGFIPIQAKRTGRSLATTTLTVTVHSPSDWLREGMRRWPRDPREETALGFTERYCAEHADVLIGTSRGVLEWARAQGWRIPEGTRVIGCLPPAAATGVRRSGPDLSHLAFFGPLDTRRGVELFCRTLSALFERDGHGVRTVTFLGDPGLVQGDLAVEFIPRTCRFWASRGVRYQLNTGLDLPSSVSFLRESGAVAVMPYLQDSCPYPILACLEGGIPFLASRASGAGELASSEALFTPDARGLAAAIEDRAELTSRISPHYRPEKAKEDWLKLASAAAQAPAADAGGPSPKVSICVAHFNHGKYLPQLLASLARGDYENFEVIVVDDGSTCPLSQDEFSRQEALYRKRGWTFLRKANEGIGATRNFAARRASGDYLVFMDADNVALPHMLSTFVSGMRASGVDCLACHLHVFGGDEPPPEGFVPRRSNYYLGPCLELGLLEDVFGDANFCVKRDVFWRLEGFTTDRDTSCEDWEFLARLALRGFSQDVIPEVLLLYRHLDGGFSRVTSSVENRRRVLRSYPRVPGFSWERVCENILYPLYNGWEGAPRPVFHPDLRALVEWIGWLDARPRLNKLVTIPLKHGRRFCRGLARAASRLAAAWTSARATSRAGASSKIRVYLFFNEARLLLLEDYFLASLKDDWQVTARELRVEAGGDFGTQTFKRIVHEKVSALVREIIPGHPEGSIIIVSDTDVQFFRRCEDLILECLRDKDIVFQSEWGGEEGVNTGFVAMRCNSAVLAFWSHVEAGLRASLADPAFVDDQILANEALREGRFPSLKWGVFPDEIWASSNTRLSFASERFRSIRLHHANGTIPFGRKSGLELKIEQLERVRAEMTAHRGAGIRVYVFFNEAQRRLLEDYFLASLKDDWSVTTLRLDGEGNGDFGTPAFKRLMHQKIRALTREIIPRHAEHDVIIMSDIDIQFFRSCEDLVLECLRDKDIVFQSEWGGGEGVNTGFVAMRCSPAVRAFWSHVEDGLRASLEEPGFVNEQRLANEALRTGRFPSLRWGVFPDDIWAWSNQRVRMGSGRFYDIRLHHANGTSPTAEKASLDLKIEQLEAVRAAMKAGRLRPAGTA